VLNLCITPLFIHEKCLSLASELKLLNMQGKDLNRLKLVLVEKKRTGLWLSEQLGVSNTTVSKWCSNVTQPSLPTLDRIAELLGCEKRDLIID
jgi:DNA-binding Xre family transcriptional regulator